MRSKLISLDYDAPMLEVSLDSTPVVVGRSADAGIRLDDLSVSHFHCRIDDVDGQLVVSDLGSRHGTFVNGARITESPLLPGDSLSIGMLSFFLRCTPESDQPLEAIESETGVAASTAGLFHQPVPAMG